MNSYIVEYFPENEDAMQTMFVTAANPEDAKAKVIDRCGAFIMIVACNLTRSAGGEGSKLFQTSPELFPAVSNTDSVVTTSIEFEDEPVTSETKPAKLVAVIKEPAAAKVVTEKAPKVPKAPKEPKVKVVSDKPVKVTNASRIREQVVIAKAEGLDKASVIAWAMENCGQSKGTAAAYLKVIWEEVIAA